MRPEDLWIRDVDPVCVVELEDEMEAEVILSVFRANGVRSYPASGNSTFSLFGGATPPPSHLRMIRIMVHPDDVELANELLDLGDENEVAELEAEFGAEVDEELGYEEEEEAELLEDEVADAELATDADYVDPEMTAAPLAAPSPMRGLAIGFLLLAFLAAVTIVLLLALDVL